LKRFLKCCALSLVLVLAATAVAQTLTGTVKNSTTGKPGAGDEVVLLGLGADGHAASLFPGTRVLEERRRWAAGVTDAGLPPRITLTYPALESCRRLAFLVSGASKRWALSGLLQGDRSLPAARLNPQGEAWIFTDKDAAPD